jgi:hypothetical protein
VPFLLVLAVLAVEIVVLFGASVDDSLVADDWTIVEERATSLGAALTLEALGPHFLPLQSLVLAALFRVVGVEPVAYHLVVLALAWLSAVLVVLLGRRLTGNLGLGAVAGALFLAYGTHYEAVLWPAAGVSYTLATVLCLGGLLLYLRAHEPAVGARGRRVAYAGFLAAVLLAPFAYPQGVMLIAAAALSRLFVLERGVAFDRSTVLPRARAWARDLLAPALLVLGFFAFNAWLDPEAATYVERRGVADEVEGYANSLLYVPLPGVGRSQINDVWRSSEAALDGPAVGGVDAFTAVVVVALLLLVAILWRGRPHHRVLGCWIALIVAGMVVATGTVFSRHLFLIAAPASILWAAVLWELVPRVRAALGRLGVRGNGAAALVLLPSAAVLLVFVGAGAAYGIEQRETWSAAAAETDDLVDQVDRSARANPSASMLFLVDPPAARSSPSGEPAWTLPPWSAAATIRVRFPGRFEHVEAVYTRHLQRRGWLISEDQLRALSRDPGVLLLRYEAKADELRQWPPAGAAPSRLVRRSAVATAAIDRVGGRASSVSVPAGQAVEVVGWAVDRRKQAAGGVVVTVDGQPRVQAEYGRDRPDVAALGAGAPRAVGFVATIPAEALPPGRHTIGLWVLSPNGRTYNELPDAAVVEVGAAP